MEMRGRSGSVLAFTQVELPTGKLQTIGVTVLIHCTGTAVWHCRLSERSSMEAQFRLDSYHFGQRIITGLHSKCRETDIIICIAGQCI